MKKLAKKWRVIRALIVVSIVVGLVVCVFTHNGRGPQEIEGLWKSSYYSACLCDSEHFFEFKDGKITRYSDVHLTDYGAGEFEKLADGLYRVTFPQGTQPDLVWEVRPGKRRWLAPPDKEEPLLRAWARRFYRPWNQESKRRMIATAPQRDAELEAAFSTSEAEKPAQASPR